MHLSLFRSLPERIRVGKIPFPLEKKFTDFEVDRLPGEKKDETKPGDPENEPYLYMEEK
jgi:hypothetical protein